MARQLHGRDRDRQALPGQFGHRRRRSDRSWDGQSPVPAVSPQARSAASTAGPASKNRGYRVTTNAGSISKAPKGGGPVKHVPGHGQSWHSCHCAKMQTCFRGSTKNDEHRSALLKARADRQSIQQQSDESSSADEAVAELQLQ